MLVECRRIGGSIVLVVAFCTYKISFLFGIVTYTREVRYYLYEVEGEGYIVVERWKQVVV